MSEDSTAYTVETVEPAPEAEQVKRLLDDYDAARKFDKEARKQYAIDRRFAAGNANPEWVVSTNLIGAHIDILSSYLYARDPDVDCRPAERIERAEAQEMKLPGMPDPSRQEVAERQDFARTLALVISRLWAKGKLKKAARKQVRSALSVGPGWMKVIMHTDTRRDPQVEHDLNDARDNMMRLEAQKKAIDSGEVKDTETAIAEMELTIQGLEEKVEVLIRKGLAIDFVAAEDVQVSLDVRETEDYLEADWIAGALYRPKQELTAIFPDLTEGDVKAASCYYQRKPQDSDGGSKVDRLNDGDAETFGKDGAINAGDNAVEFAKIIEIWDRRDNMVKTCIDGLKKWARQPYTPPQKSSRFYPWFQLAFFLVDGQRHPQSLSWRLQKLQDEYASTRSSYRLTRRRSIPGILFNAAQVGPEEAKKLERSVHQEFVGLKTTTPDADMRALFAEKPTARIDPALFDVTPILHDMEMISGVQDAKRSNVMKPKTATEAEIQEQGFESRTSSDRDTIEDMLRDMAVYTAELALQTMTIQEVQRMAGPEAFWPEGMDIEDLLTLAEVDIDAGSTGRPNTTAEREAWSVALPLIREVMMQIQEAEVTGNQPMADALRELLRETLRRMDDRVDVERFIPATQPVLPAPVGPVGPDGLPIPAGVDAGNIPSRFDPPAIT